MGKRIYVGNLNYQTTEDSLRTSFTEFGEVEEVRLITDRYSGRSKGFAFVEMATEEEAQAAITGMNGKVLDDRELKVAEARPRRDRENRPSRHSAVSGVSWLIPFGATALVVQLRSTNRHAGIVDRGSAVTRSTFNVSSYATHQRYPLLPKCFHV